VVSDVGLVERIPSPVYTIASSDDDDDSQSASVNDEIRPPEFIPTSPEYSPTSPNYWVTYDEFSRRADIYSEFYDGRFGGSPGRGLISDCIQGNPCFFRWKFFSCDCLKRV